MQGKAILSKVKDYNKQRERSLTKIAKLSTTRKTLEPYHYPMLKSTKGSKEFLMPHSRKNSKFTQPAS